MSEVKNLESYFAKFDTTWSPQIVGELNGQHVKLVKLDGDKCPWHAHAHEDEMFLVIEGRLEIQLRDRSLALGPNDFFIVPRGVEHRVVPLTRTRVLLFEPKGIAHTGEVNAEITKANYDFLD